MLRQCCYALALGLTLCAIGCGSGGGSGSPAAVGGSGPVSADSPFKGTWTGYWWDGAYQDALTVTVAQDGRVTGLVDDPFIPTQAAVTGTLRDDGSLAATYQFPDRDRVTVTGTVVVRDSDGRLVGSLRARQGGDTGQIQIVLARS
jgi:hypothetical protein